MTLFNIFLLTIFLDMSQIQLLFPILGKLQIQKIVTAIAILGLISQPKLIENMRNAMNTPVVGLFIFMVTWILLSIPFGVYPGQSLLFITQSYWKILVMLLLVTSYVSTMEDINRLIWVYISAVAFLAILTIQTASDGRMEINADVYDANDTALQFLMAIPFAFWKYKSSKGIRRLAAIIICGILIIGIVKTSSRGGFLGLVAVVIMILLQIKSLENKSMFGVIIILLIMSAGFLYLADDSYLNRISTMLTPSKDYNLSDSTGRVQIWERGIQMMFINPVLGVGVYNFMTAEGVIFAEIGARYQAAHNSFVQIGAELGIPGFAAFCLLLWKTVKRIKQITAEAMMNRESNLLIIANTYSVTGSMTGFAVSGFFLSAAYTTSLYFLLALSIAIMSENMHKSEHAVDGSDGHKL